MILEVEGSKKDKSSLGDMMKRKRERDEKVIKQQILRKQLTTRAAGGEDAFARTASRPSIEDASDSEGDDVSEDDDDDTEPAAAAAPAVVPKYLKRALAAGKKQKPTSFRDDRFFIAATPNAAQSDVRIVDANSNLVVCC